MGTAEDYRLHVRMVYRVCLGILRDPAEAEDAAQDTFMRYLKGGFKGQSRLSTYLYSIATRVCLDRLRKLRRDEVFRERWQQMQEASGEPGTSSEKLILVVQLLSDESLDPDDIHFAVCYHVHGMTEAEIAKATGFKRRTVGYRLARFKERARARVGEKS
jgi:RNA polymerase sigma-70 factor, ECF subfamily